MRLSPTEERIREILLAARNAALNVNAIRICETNIYNQNARKNALVKDRAENERKMLDAMRALGITNQDQSYPIESHITWFMAEMFRQLGMPELSAKPLEKRGALPLNQRGEEG